MPPTLLYKVVASDMDGTLLNDEHHMSERTKSVLFDLLHYYGVSFAFATGRHHLCVTSAKTDLQEYMEQQKVLQAEKLQAMANDVTPGDVYLVSSNGARVHGADGSLVLAHDIPPAIVAALYRDHGLPYTSKKKGFVAHDGMQEDVVSVSVYTTTNWFMSAMLGSMEEMERKFGFCPSLIHYPDEPTMQNDLQTESVFDYYPLRDVGKVCFRSFDLELLATLEKNLRATYQKDGEEVLSIAFSSDNCLDVMVGGVSKGSALGEIVTLLNQKHDADAAPITVQQTVAFGDSMNDKEMLYMAGKGYYMKNAQERLKEELRAMGGSGAACEETLWTNEDDGVARTLMRIFDL